MIVYMNISGIRGTGGGARPGWIWLEKCTFGFERTGETEVDDETPDTPKKPELQAVVVEKPSDATSASILRWMSKGEPRTVKLEFGVNTRTAVMICTLQQARVRTYRAYMNAATRDPFVQELISITYSSIEVQYKQYGADNAQPSGQTQFQYDAESS